MWIGDVYARAIWGAEESASRPTEQANGVDATKQEVGFEPGLENQSISAGIVAGEHPRNESLDEQRYGINSLLAKGKVECPIELQGDRGHVLIDNVLWTEVDSSLYESVELSATFLHESEYQPRVGWYPQVVPNDYGVSSDGVVALPSGIDGVYTTDTPRSEQSPTVTGVGTPDGALDLYALPRGEYNLEYPIDSYSEMERVAPVRVFQHNDATESDWDRVYLSRQTTDDTLVVGNGVVRFVFNDGGSHHLTWYDGSQWIDGGTIDLPNDRPILEEASTHVARIRLGDIVVSVVRGQPLVRLEVVGETSVTWETGNGEYPVDSALTTSGHYAHASNSNLSREYMMVKPSSDGNFTSVGTTALEMNSLTNTESYNLRIGMNFTNTTTEDIANWSLVKQKMNREVVPR